MNEGRVKTRPTRVNIQRGEASQEGCNVVPHNAHTPSNISEMQVYDRRPQRKKKVPSCGTH